MGRHHHGSGDRLPHLDDRLVVDAKLASDPDRIEAMGIGELEAAAKKLAYQLDPASFVDRRARPKKTAGSPCDPHPMSCPSSARYSRSRTGSRSTAP